MKKSAEGYWFFAPKDSVWFDTKILYNILYNDFSVVLFSRLISCDSFNTSMCLPGRNQLRLSGHDGLPPRDAHGALAGVGCGARLSAVSTRWGWWKGCGKTFKSHPLEASQGFKRSDK